MSHSRHTFLSKNFILSQFSRPCSGFPSKFCKTQRNSSEFSICHVNFTSGTHLTAVDRNITCFQIFPSYFAFREGYFNLLKDFQFSTSGHFWVAHKRSGFRLLNLIEVDCKCIASLNWMEMLTVAFYNVYGHFLEQLWSIVFKAFIFTFKLFAPRKSFSFSTHLCLSVKIQLIPFPDLFLTTYLTVDLRKKHYYVFKTVFDKKNRQELNICLTK